MDFLKVVTHISVCSRQICSNAVQKVLVGWREHGDGAAFKVGWEGGEGQAWWQEDHRVFVVCNLEGLGHLLKRLRFLLACHFSKLHIWADCSSRNSRAKAARRRRPDGKATTGFSCWMFRIASRTSGKDSDRRFGLPRHYLTLSRIDCSS